MTYEELFKELKNSDFEYKGRTAKGSDVFIFDFQDDGSWLKVRINQEIERCKVLFKNSELHIIVSEQFDTFDELYDFLTQ